MDNETNTTFKLTRLALTPDQVDLIRIALDNYLYIPESGRQFDNDQVLDLAAIVK